MDMYATITLSTENAERACLTIENVIRQAQDGVTVFSAPGILFTILTDLNYLPVEA